MTLLTGCIVIAFTVAAVLSKGLLRSFIIGCIVALVFTGCTATGWNVHSGQASVDDLYCGTLKSPTADAPLIAVRLRALSSSFISCQEVVDAVTAELKATPLEESWTITVGLGASCTTMQNVRDEPGVFGIPVNSTAPRPVWARGCTWPVSHFIGVVGLDPETLHHEFGHAYDAEHDLPNTRDRAGIWVAP